MSQNTHLSLYYQLITHTPIINISDQELKVIAIDVRSSHPDKLVDKWAPTLLNGIIFKELVILALWILSARRLLDSP